MSEYVAELDRLLSTEIPWFRSHKLGPYEELDRRHFPFSDCDGDPLLMGSFEVAFFREIAYHPRAKSYVVVFSSDVVRVGFHYDVKKRSAESYGPGWVDK